MGDLIRSALAAQVRAEFDEMPGLSLSVPQAARLWSLTPSQSATVLRGLADTGFLLRDAQGTYRRRGTQRCWNEH